MAFYKRKGARKVSRKPRARRAPKKQTFAKKVLQVIHKQAENKIAYSTTGDTPSYFIGNTTVGGIGNIFAIVPNITRGLNEGDRIGNAIKPLNLNVRGHLIYRPTGAGSFSNTQSRIAVRMMVIQPKQFSNYGHAYNTQTWFSQLLAKGNTTVAFTGKLSDLHAPINKDSITVYQDKRFYMTATQVAQVTAVGYYTIDNKDATKFFNFNIPVKKTLTYDDNVTSGLQPMNFSPVILIGWTYLDGTAVGTDAFVGMSYDSTLTFEDS